MQDQESKQNGDMTDILRIADLPTGNPTSFLWTPDRAQMNNIAKALDLLALRKMRLEGEIRPQGTSDWTLEAKLGATVVQPCVVTLDPVTTRIEEPFTRIYVANWSAPEDSEVELEDGEDSEPVPELLDLAALAHEALALALPLNPRSPQADEIETNFGPEGVAPLSDETVKPFAGLADLKKKLESGE